MKSPVFTSIIRKSPRQATLRRLALSICACLAGACLFAEDAPTGDQALQTLMDGNKRFEANQAQKPHQSPERRTELTKGQAPFAIVLTCSDSRVSPEVLFDQGLGDLFVIRNAGNVLDDHTLGSLEYAVEHLHVHLVVVLGHAQCGAVSAAVAGGHAPGHIQSVVDAIEPAVEETKELAGDKVDNAVRANIRRVAGILNRVEPILGEAVKKGELKVVAGRYDLATGKVELIK